MPASACQESPQSPCLLLDRNGTVWAGPCHSALAQHINSALFMPPSHSSLLHIKNQALQNLLYCSNQPSININMVIHGLTFWKSFITNEKSSVHGKTLIINNLFSNAETNWNILAWLRKLFTVIGIQWTA